MRIMMMMMVWVVHPLMYHGQSWIHWAVVIPNMVGIAKLPVID